MLSVVVSVVVVSYVAQEFNSLMACCGMKLSPFRSIQWSLFIASDW